MVFESFAIVYMVKNEYIKVLTEMSTVFKYNFPVTLDYKYR